MHLALDDALSVIVVVVFWSTFAFPIIAGTFWKWWRSEFGWSYMIKVILLAMALAPATLHRMFGLPVTSVFYLWFAIFAIGLIAPVVWWRLWVLWTVQRDGRSRNPVTAVRDWWRYRRQQPWDSGPQAKVDVSQ